MTDAEHAPVRYALPLLFRVDCLDRFFGTYMNLRFPANLPFRFTHALGAKSFWPTVGYLVTVPYLYSPLLETGEVQIRI